MLLNDIQHIYLGSKAVKKIYLGNTLVWPKEQPVKKYRLSRLISIDFEFTDRVVIFNQSTHNKLISKNGDLFNTFVDCTIDSDGYLELPADAAVFSTRVGCLYYGSQRCWSHRETEGARPVLSTISGEQYALSVSNVGEGVYALTVPTGTGTYFLANDGYFHPLETVSSVAPAEIYYITEV